jgi:hypothetical protein
VIEAKRVKELEKEVNKCVGGFDSEFNGIVAWIDLLEFFKDYAALKVENERLRERAATLEIDVYARTGRLEKAEAQLAKQAPLIEAVMKGDYNQLAVDAEYFTQPDSKKVMFAALALREERK